MLHSLADVLLPAEASAASSSSSSSSSSSIKSTTSTTSSSYWPFRSFLLFLLLICLAFVLRVSVSGGGYSGYNQPPMYGDYEAQRHWMEITVNLPISTWYFNTTQNDLLYWGLDYPPLTAYVSYLCGKLAIYMGEGGLVSLFHSRGYQSSSSKLFMRSTVWVSDLLFFVIPAIYLMNKLYSQHTSQHKTLILTCLLLIHPAYILIDHGHFQYNCIALGLVVLAINSLLPSSSSSSSSSSSLPSSSPSLTSTQRVYLSAFFFVSALCFKQMTLYYSPAFFFCLLAWSRYNTQTGEVISLCQSFQRVIGLGVIVIAAFVLYFSPFLSVEALSQVLHRVFPFARGLYEDKVANFWCATSIVIKWHLWFDKTVMIRASLICTLASLLPSCIHLYFHPSRRAFLYSLSCSAFSFFLFSFQVHEKTILLPLLPLCLLSGYHSTLFANVSCVAIFSMFPLLTRDGQSIQYVVTSLLFYLASFFFAQEEITSASIQSEQKKSKQQQQGTQEQHSAPLYVRVCRSIVTYVNHRSHLFFRLAQLSVFGCVVIHIASFFIPHIPRYPDIVQYLFVLYAAPHFILAHIYLFISQIASASYGNEHSNQLFDREGQLFFDSPFNPFQEKKKE